MNVLVDSSVWIDYFRGGSDSSLDGLIEENLICIKHFQLISTCAPLKLLGEAR